MKKIKGFTLIELIVVMAIFMVILAAAMQFMPVVEKIMTFSDVQHDGSAAVTNISTFLENELSPVEYIDLYDSDQDAQSAALEFATKYYEGVLVSGSTKDTHTYASGTVHVLKIDNTNGGRISRFNYNCTFAPGAVTATPIDAENSVLNEAFYDNAEYKVVIGAFSDADITNGGAGSTYEELAANMSAKKTQFTILGEVTRGSSSHPKVYNYNSTASLSMVNIIARGGGGVPTYYVIKNDPTDLSNKSIVSITDASLAQRAAIGGTEARRDGTLDQATRLFYSGGSTDHYTFVYSYGSEINT
jgi:prepilin-type N-terminal cleavage/methylation domain-containing protein